MRFQGILIAHAEQSNNKKDHEEVIMVFTLDKRRKKKC